MGGVTGEDMLSRAYRAAEFPGATMFASAHSLARRYAATVSDVDGIRLLQPDTVAAMTVAQTDRTRMHGVPPDLLPPPRDCPQGERACRFAPAGSPTPCKSPLARPRRDRWGRPAGLPLTAQVGVNDRPAVT